MPDFLGRPLQEACLCGNNNPFKIRRYYTEQDQFLGILCEACNHEWLNEYAMPRDPEDEVDGINLGGHNLHRHMPRARQFDADLQVNARTIVEDLSQLKPGDHFAYQRPYVIWHHGIVKRVDKQNRRFEAIHWQKPNARCQIIKSWVNVDEENGQLYRIDYPEETSRVNKVHLVIARAVSMIGTLGYNFFMRNCEHFARFCKTGLGESIQTHYFINLVRRSVRRAVQATYTRFATEVPVIIGRTAGKYLTAEMVEKAVRGTNKVGAAVVVIFEGVFMIWDLSKIHKQRTGSEISFREYLKATITRTLEAVCAAGGTIAGAMIGEAAGGTTGAFIGAAVGTMFCPFFGTAVGAAIGTPVGVFVGGIIGGIIGGVLGHAGGTFLGHIIGGGIVSWIKHDDRAVKSITDLKEGDQIVFYCWALHPRCHAIVVGHDARRNVKVIRSTYERGVVEEWVEYKDPVYRVTYMVHEIVPVAETMRRARSKIGRPNDYNLLTNNCKHFAEWCKVRR